MFSWGRGAFWRGFFVPRITCMVARGWHACYFSFFRDCFFIRLSYRFIKLILFLLLPFSSLSSQFTLLFLPHFHPSWYLNRCWFLRVYGVERDFWQASSKSDLLGCRQFHDLSKEGKNSDNICSSYNKRNV